MLDDDHGRRRPGEFGGKFERGSSIVVVVVGQLLALHLFGLGNAGAERAIRNIERGILMRVFAIAQRRHQTARRHADRRKFLALVGTGEPAGDRGVVGSGGGERLGGHRLAKIDSAGAAGRLELGEQPRVVGRVGQDRDIGVVLGSRAHHRRAADIDVLDDLVARRAFGDGGLERVEVDHHEVDRADAVLLHRRGVGRIVADGEQAAVDHRV